MSSFLSSPSCFFSKDYTVKIKSKFRSKIYANLSTGNEDNFFNSAASAASIRFRESLRSGVGAKVSKDRMLLHVPLESSDIPADLCKKGFNGNKPSLWVLQGLPFTSMSSFKSILSIVSSLAMEGCIFIGELPDLLLEDKSGSMYAKHKIEKLFMRHGFQVHLSDFSEMVRELQLHLPPGDCRLFTSRQLRLSDAQMEAWREHFGRLEEEVDEEGFEEM